MSKETDVTAPVPPPQRYPEVDIRARPTGRAALPAAIGRLRGARYKDAEDGVPNDEQTT